MEVQNTCIIMKTHKYNCYAICIIEVQNTCTMKTQKYNCYAICIMEVPEYLYYNENTQIHLLCYFIMEVPEYLYNENTQIQLLCHFIIEAQNTCGV